MDAGDLILVSVDDHLIEPSDLFDGRLPARYRDQAPRVTRTDDGADVWTFNGTVIPNVGLNAVAGRPREEYGVDPTAFDTPRARERTARRALGATARDRETRAPTPIRGAPSRRNSRPAERA